jgi:maltose O-acetyltransferase
MKTISVFMGVRRLLALILGHLAVSCWFFPSLALKLHELRGVQFKDRRSVFLGRGVLIDNRYPELIEIGADVWLTAGCVILSHSLMSDTQRDRAGMREQVRAVTIGAGVFIGVRSIICPGTQIGEGCYIAAGSVVRGRLRPYSLYAGNPASLIRPLTASGGDPAKVA